MTVLIYGEERRMLFEGLKRNVTVIYRLAAMFMKWHVYGVVEEAS